ncbi:MAG TPA: SgcJ/EcaC family oxidoreductase, partial [Acidisarcina sp.]
MKRRALLVLVGGAIGFALPTFAQQTNTADPQIAQQLEAIGQKSDEAWIKGDATTVASFFTQDAVLVTDQGPIFGREAIEKWHANIFQQVHFSKHLTQADQHSPPVLGPASDTVWWFGAWSSTVQGPTGPPQQGSGYWSALHRRESDAWKICLLTFNVTPPAAAA